MYLMQIIQVMIVLIIENIPSLKKMSSINIPSILQEYWWVISTKRHWFEEQYPLHSFTVEDLDNTNGIHAFNRFEEEGNTERFKCRFRIVNFVRDTSYALDTAASKIYNQGLL